MQLAGLRGTRIGLLTNLLGTDPADAEVTTVVRAAVGQMKAQDAEVVEVTIPGLNEVMLDRMNGFLILSQDFKFDFNAYLAAHPTAPVRTLEEVLAAGKFHPSLETGLRGSQALDSRDTKEYLEHIVKRDMLRQAILKAMADARLDALAYPTIRRKANVVGQVQPGTNCHLSANSGLPAIVVPGGFTPDGLPVGVELLGARVERAAADQARVRVRAGDAPPAAAGQHAGAGATVAHGVSDPELGGGDVRRAPEQHLSASARAPRPSSGWSRSPTDRRAGR